MLVFFFLFQLCLCDCHICGAIISNFGSQQIRSIWYVGNSNGNLIVHREGKTTNHENKQHNCFIQFLNQRQNGFFNCYEFQENGKKQK